MLPAAKFIAITTLSIFAATPAVAALFLTWKRRDLSKRVSIETKVNAVLPSEDDIRSIPQNLRDAPSDWVLSIERASKAVPRARLPDLGTEELLVKYLRANMISFTYTPQAPLLRSMVKDLEAKWTFETSYLETLDFEVGDLVVGVFRVVLKERGRIELALDSHESFKGPKTEGRIVARVEERGGDVVVFFNGE
jgi:hypothetical protein